MNDFKKMSELFHKAAKCCDNIIELEIRKNAGEEVTEELETAGDLFIVCLLKLQAIGDQ